MYIATTTCKWVSNLKSDLHNNYYYRIEIQLDLYAIMNRYDYTVSTIIILGGTCVRGFPLSLCMKP